MSVAANHPFYLASELAVLLELDLVMTSQIKEHVPVGRLVEILGIERAELPVECLSVSEALENHGKTDEDALVYVLEQFSKTEILKALNAKK